MVETLKPVQRAMLAILRGVDELRRWRQHGSGHGQGLLVLDEATAFLGQDGKREILALIRAVAGDGAGVLVVTMTSMRRWLPRTGSPCFATDGIWRPWRRTQRRWPG